MPGATLAIVLLLLQPADLACELGRFPPKAVARSNWEFARDHYLWVCQQRDYSARVRDRHFWEWECWCNDAWTCKEAWDLLDTATSTSASEALRRDSLRRLRLLLGDEAYLAGWMPPPAPVWRFRRLE